MMQGYKESLIAWFGRNINLSECADGSVLITVPIVDEYNDDISLYIYDRGDSFRISDKGETFRSLYGMSLSLKDDCDARTAIDAVLARFGAYLSDSDKSISSISILSMIFVSSSVILDSAFFFFLMNSISSSFERDCLHFGQLITSLFMS